MILKSFKDANFKVFLGALRRWPVFALQTALLFFALVSLSAFDIMAAKNIEIVETNNPSTSRLRKYQQ
ncbi:hypothetical protein CBP27_07850 [Fischerella thermalis WC542]|nr:hypothetical protein CBP27_07850 [Fischerella thermalis WC542]